MDEVVAEELKRQGLPVKGPFPLEDADIDRPFVYCREIGLLYVPWSHHTSVMEHLMAIRLSARGCYEAADKLGIALFDLADYWLEHTAGAAFRTGVKRGGAAMDIAVWSEDNLTNSEIAIFGKVRQLKYCK